MSPVARRITGRSSSTCISTAPCRRQPPLGGGPDALEVGEVVNVSGLRGLWFLDEREENDGSSLTRR